MSVLAWQGEWHEEHTPQTFVSAARPCAKPPVSADGDLDMDLVEEQKVACVACDANLDHHVGLGNGTVSCSACMAKQQVFFEDQAADKVAMDPLATVASALWPQGIRYPALSESELRREGLGEFRKSSRRKSAAKAAADDPSRPPLSHPALDEMLMILDAIDNLDFRPFNHAYVHNVHTV